MDNSTTINEIKEWIQRFDDERDWHQYHHPKELAISISLEASELLENFQWKDKQPIESIKSDRKLMQSLEEELADIIIYSLNFANQLDIDVSEIIKHKLEEKYQRPCEYPFEFLLHILQFTGNIDAMRAVFHAFTAFDALARQRGISALRATVLYKIEHPAIQPLFEKMLVVVEM